jgi:hypothetical protein
MEVCEWLEAAINQALSSLIDPAETENDAVVLQCSGAIRSAAFGDIAVRFIAVFALEINCRSGALTQVSNTGE